MKYAIVTCAAGHCAPWWVVTRRTSSTCTTIIIIVVVGCTTSTNITCLAFGTASWTIYKIVLRQCKKVRSDTWAGCRCSTTWICSKGARCASWGHTIVVVVGYTGFTSCSWGTSWAWWHTYYSILFISLKMKIYVNRNLLKHNNQNYKFGL